MYYYSNSWLYSPIFLNVLWYNKKKWKFMCRHYNKKVKRLFTIITDNT